MFILTDDEIYNARDRTYILKFIDMIKNECEYSLRIVIVINISDKILVLLVNRIIFDFLIVSKNCLIYVIIIYEFKKV